MLKLTVLGSSSKGNCYVIGDDTTKLVIDIGVKGSDKFIDYSKVDGVLLSHSHLDHTQDIKNIRNLYKDNFYSNRATLDILPILDYQKIETIENTPFEIGNFRIVSFSVYHDVDCNGYLIKHLPSNMKIVFITDTSSVSNIQFKDIDVFVIEANHSWEWLDNKESVDFKDYRTYGEQGHLAVEDTIEFLLNNINHNTKKIILTHISRSAENYLEMQEKVESAINNKNIQVIALNPKMAKPVEYCLQEEIDIDFD